MVEALNVCPICKSKCFQSIKTVSKIKSDDDKAVWLFCKCGCVYNNEDCKDVFNDEYPLKLKDMKNAKDRFEHYFNVYGSFIEEIAYGRKFLDVGFCLDYNIKQMRERGWLSTGIDLFKNDYHTGDFLTYDWGKEKFDLIKMSGYLQCVNDPTSHIKRAFELLNNSGVLFVTTPDTDMIREGMFPDWGHWNAKECRQHINIDILTDMLRKCGEDLASKFEIKLVNRDYSKRFPSWNTVHVIAQKVSR